MAPDRHPGAIQGQEAVQASEDAAERRRYFRVEDHILMEYRLLAGSERQEVVRTLRDDHPSRHLIASSFANTSRQMQYVLHKIQEREPEIALYLQTLNEKLDSLARQLATEATAFRDQTLRRVDISAAGLGFDAPEQMEADQLLEIKMLLSPSLDFIRAIGRVVRCVEAFEAQDRPAFRIAVDFDFIRDDDRELLVQHVVRKESSQLREERSS